MGTEYQVPNCAGKWELFDSTDIRDHEKAAQLCATCPAFEWCLEQRGKVIAQQRKSGKYGMAGTWAGRLYGQPQLTADRIRTEDEMFTDEDAKTAHRDWNRGLRNDRVRIGERVYQRRAAQRQRAAREAA
jgi:hypothetical protein